MVAQLMKSVGGAGILDMIISGGNCNSNCSSTDQLYYGAIFHFRLSRLQHAHTLLPDLFARHVRQLPLLLLLLLLLLVDFMLDDVLALYRYCGHRRCRRRLPLFLLDDRLSGSFRRRLGGPLDIVEKRCEKIDV